MYSGSKTYRDLLLFNVIRNLHVFNISIGSKGREVKAKQKSRKPVAQRSTKSQGGLTGKEKEFIPKY